MKMAKGLVEKYDLMRLLFWQLWLILKINDHLFAEIRLICPR